jgi:S-formylglutathione hydrolase FrmB
LEHLNRRLHGHVDDYTQNHGADRRIWSPALGQKRDLYVYLPPGYDPVQRYPLVVYLHGYSQDEQSFLSYLVEPLDKAMATGKLPPAIVAVPDGSLDGHPCARKVGSFFINSKAGAFEDYVMHDVWDFVLEHYPIRPERDAHALTGVSMGGAAAFNLAIKYRDRVRYVAAIFPPLNLRYVDCHGRYRRPFDPDCNGLRTDLSRGHEVLGRFYVVIVVTVKRLLDPIYDRKDPEAIHQMSRENPLEMLDAYDVHEGDLGMFVGYGGRDQFNINSQIESFLYRAKQNGLTVDVAYDPKGRHDVATALKLLPDLLKWLSPRLGPYSPREAAKHEE